MHPVKMSCLGDQWIADQQLDTLLTSLREHLAQGRFGQHEIEWITRRS